MLGRGELDKDIVAAIQFT